ncbi:Acyltransferase family protein [Aquisphaera giovannonii]|uniref:Acyltransferase family protein n=1 Tax=Aquisphaera giovannonii TaxID=406548 RepID=A0A5B9VZD8_9BACT|nr:acyltransferase family protein [Aquisphaera giovannonii]QEH33327.1 Acyltransferase family protein [Aquisphaera giovannonii]
MWTEPGGSTRPKLPALSGVRIFAAVHIYLFHVKQAHDAGLLTFGIIERLPACLTRLMSRGYVSTGFFFELSGFLLAYAYLDGRGRLKMSAGRFWRGRLFRLYPLYLLSLVLLIPAPALLPFTARHATPLEIAGGVATSLTMVQAWFPPFALWWNAPAWALSAFAAFYAAFPLAGRLTLGMDRSRLLRLAGLMAFLAWLPPALYLTVDPYGDAWTVRSIDLGGTWLTVLRFHPLSWLPQFLAGVLLGRWFGLGIDREEIEVRTSAAAPRTSAGDLVMLGMFAGLALVPGIPYVPLRHGLLAPALLVVIVDLARGRGLLAWGLSNHLFARASEASFPLFALQMPAGLWFCVFFVDSAKGSTGQLLGMISWTLGASMLWVGLSSLNAGRIKRAVQEKPRCLNHEPPGPMLSHPIVAARKAYVREDGVAS